MNNKTAAKIITEQKTMIVQKEPFYSSLLFRLDFKGENSIPTMATDGRSVLYNPDFVTSITPKQVRGVIVHEILHCCMLHFDRMSSREPGRWNAAFDYAINPIVKQKFDLPEGCLEEARFDGMSAEEIYNILEKEGKEFPQPSVGAVMSPKGSGSGGSDSTLAEEWKGHVVYAAQEAAKIRGSVPAGLERLIADLGKNKICWRDVLRRFVQNTCKSDYTWKMPSARFLPSGLYMPSMQSESMPPLVVAVDTSGSIGDRELSAFGAEMQSIIEEVKPEKVVVLYCDADVAHVDEFLPGDPLHLTPKGGGGTDFRPVFDWIQESGEEFSACVYLTDMYGSFPESEILPTMWVAISDVEAPFGETIRLEL